MVLMQLELAGLVDPAQVPSPIGVAPVGAPPGNAPPAAQPPAGKTPAT
jgi:hypothetical protein